MPTQTHQSSQNATGVVLYIVNEVPFVPSVSIRKCSITCVLLNIILHMFFKNDRCCQMWAFFNLILHVVY